MFDAIARIYSKTSDKQIVRNAVEIKHWITADDYKKITGDDLLAT